MAAGFAPAIIAAMTGSALIAPITFVLLTVMAALLWGSLMRSGEKRMLMLH